MELRKIKTALVGCGAISGIYLKNLKEFDIIELVGCSDIIDENAQKRAEEFGIRKMTFDEILADPTIELVVNTTAPLQHYEVAKATLLAGKSVYNEKTLCENIDQANELITLANEKKLFFGGAPDTFFSGSLQLARSIIDSGVIGKPIMAQAFLSRYYHHERTYEGWGKPFVFCRHGGILFDMGAYYLTALVFLLGAVKSVAGYSTIHNPDRIYQSSKSPNFGQPMTVESTNVATGAILFENGVMGNITMLSESAPDNSFRIYCTEGYIDLGDPNLFSSAVRIVKSNGEEEIIESSVGISGGNLRGLGVAEAMYSCLSGREARCNGNLCRHILEALLGICESGESGKIYSMTTTADRPEPFEAGEFENKEQMLI